MAELPTSNTEWRACDAKVLLKDALMDGTLPGDAKAEAAFEMFKNHQAFIVRKDMAFDVLFKRRFRDLKKQVKEGKFNKKSSAGANKAWRFSNAKKLLVEAFKNKTLSVDAFDGRRVRSRELGSIPTPIC